MSQGKHTFIHRKSTNNTYSARDPEFAARLGKDFHRAPVAPSVPSPAATRARQAQRVRRVSAAAGLTGSPSAAGPATPAPTGATPRRRPDTEPPRPASRRSTRIAARLETARPNTSDDE